MVRLVRNWRVINNAVFSVGDYVTYYKGPYQDSTNIKEIMKVLTDYYVVEYHWTDYDAGGGGNRLFASREEAGIYATNIIKEYGSERVGITISHPVAFISNRQAELFELCISDKGGEPIDSLMVEEGSSPRDIFRQRYSIDAVEIQEARKVEILP
jgi:hypothetical protein